MWNDSWRNRSLRMCGGWVASMSQVSAAHMLSPHLMGPIRMPMSLGRGVCGGGSLVANVPVRASPITIGMQIDTPHRRPPSRSQSAFASLKNSCARC